MFDSGSTDDFLSFAYAAACRPGNLFMQLIVIGTILKRIEESSHENQTFYCYLSLCHADRRLRARCRCVSGKYGYACSYALHARQRRDRRECRSTGPGGHAGPVPDRRARTPSGRRLHDHRIRRADPGRQCNPGDPSHNHRPSGTVCPGADAL